MVGGGGGTDPRPWLFVSAGHFRVETEMVRIRLCLHFAVHCPPVECVHMHLPVNISAHALSYAAT